MVVLLCGWAAPAAADFCLLTQNALRLGHGEEMAREVKREGFRGIFQGYDAVALQEVMDPAEPTLVAPEGFTATISTAKGSNSYREHYAWLTRDAALRVLARAEYDDEAGRFLRPPFGIAVEDKDNGRYWLVDIHVVFGKDGPAPRRREVAAMAEAARWYAARKLPDGSRVERVVAVGDWNLPASDEAFAALSGLIVRPDVKSTLNKQGTYVSAYDHFLWEGGRMSVDFADDPREAGGFALETYRAMLSDHVGVAGYVLAAPGAHKPPEAQCPPLRPARAGA